MPASRRYRSVLGSFAGLAVAAAGLTACDKPTPRVTVQTGNTSTTVSAQTYCFDANPDHCRVTTSGTVGTLSAVAGSSILVDVPRSVADGYWQVRSATQGTDGSFADIAADGVRSPVVHDRHSARVQVPYASGQYFLIVTEAAQGSNKATGSWVTRVVITS